ncbi:MAG TPA: ROK family protein [Thermomicrobiales bacterium]
MEQSTDATIGIDIGGTRIRVGRRDGRGGFTAERTLTPHHGADGATEIARMAHTIAPEGIARIGISCAGPLDFARGITNPLNLPGWHGYPLVGELEKRLGARVWMDNDANCAALAEWREGAGKGAQTLVYYTISTGVGTGVILGGRVHHGAHDTEGGHQIVWADGPSCRCGSRGCLEAVVSGTGLRARFGKPAEELDDPAIWDEVAKYTAIGIANTATLLCPDIIVIGGGVIARGEQLFEPLRRYAAELTRLVPVPQIVPAGLDQDSGLIGALVLAETQAD